MPSKDYNLDATPANAQRRPQNAMDDAWIRAFLNEATVGHVATHWDDQPFVTPTTFWYDADGHTVYFHSNVLGRLRANVERHPRVCLEASRFGRLLPSNVALEFSIQYESVMVFGTIALIEDAAAQRHALYGLIGKYFPDMQPGDHFRPITDKELRRTSVYALTVERWSGKRNWADEADQSDEWPALGA